MQKGCFNRGSLFAFPHYGICHPELAKDLARSNTPSSRFKVKTVGTHNYYVYILTNKNHQVLYIGVTNELRARIQQHTIDAETTMKTFAGRYNCIHLVYYERFDDINEAIRREKELKGWKRERKESLINAVNPNWDFILVQLE